MVALEEGGIRLLEANADGEILVEAGWEVCNQMGGIYTVLRSKVPAFVEKWGEGYCLVGPYFRKTAQVEFEPQPLNGIFGQAVSLMRDRGMDVHFGRWLVTGSPQVILIDYLRSFHRVADYKYFLWKDHHIETGDEPEINDAVVFGYLVVEFFEALLEVTGGQESRKNPIMALFHEWNASVALPEIRRRALPVSSVFHTHATLVGRYVALRDPGMYHHLHSIDPEAAAESSGILPRYRIERAAAWSADVFATLSDITADEAEHFLGRRPDKLLPNGLNIQRFSAIHEFQNLHALYKEKIHEFVMGHFFPSYHFDLENTRYIFTSGRYEFGNKGFDLFIESLARLNWKLKESGSPTIVIAFIVTRAAIKGVNVEVMKRQKMFYDLRGTCENISGQMGRRLVKTMMTGRIPETEDLLEEYDRMRLKRLTHVWKSEDLPSICTHDMAFDGDDPVLNRLRQCRLFNASDDRVKVVYHPDFISGTGAIFPLDYDQFVRGCHLGVFPSYYEPWGYTPLECVALGIPAITSDLAGFGTYVRDTIPDNEGSGILVLPRKNSDFYESAEYLARMIERIVTMEHKDRVQLRNRVEALSELFDWRRLRVHYDEALDESKKRYLAGGTGE